MGLLSRLRLKRKKPTKALSSTGRASANPIASLTNGASPSTNEDLQSLPLSAISCTYSCYIVILCQLISTSMESIIHLNSKNNILSTRYLLETYSSILNDEANSNPPMIRRNSISDSQHAANILTAQTGNAPSGSSFTASGHRMRVNSYGVLSMFDTANIVAKQILISANVALQVCFEVLNSLIKLDQAPDEIVYRCLAEACADVGDADKLLDLIVFMDMEGLMLDHQLRHALVRALMNSNNANLFKPNTPQPPTPPGPARNMSVSGPASSSQPATSYVASVFASESPKPQHSTLGTAATSASASTTTTGSLYSYATSFISPASSAGSSTGKGATQSSSQAASKATEAANAIRLHPSEAWSYSNWSSLRRADSAVYYRPPAADISQSSFVSKVLFNLSDPPASTLSRAGTARGSLANDAVKEAALSKSATAGPALLSREFTSATTSTGAAVAAGGGLGSTYPPLLVTTAANSTLHSTATVSTPTSTTSAWTSQPAEASGLQGLAPHLFQRDRWSESPLEGRVPNLQWNFASSSSSSSSPAASAAGPSPHPCPTEAKLPPSIALPGTPHMEYFAVSKRLHRLVRLSEQHLQRCYPSLFIDLQNPFGMKCANIYCSTNREIINHVLTVGEIYQGWAKASNVNHANNYTTVCIYCGSPFIPRFTVQYQSMGVANGSGGTVSQSASTDGREGQANGSTSAATPASSPSAPASNALWCEFLSPWTLYKETLNILFEEGVTTLLSANFPHRSYQSAVVYWNLFITFRLRGLPMTFLFSKNVVESFPAPPTKSPKKP